MGKTTISMRDNSEFNERDAIEMMEMEDIALSQEDTNFLEESICNSNEYANYIL